MNGFDLASRPIRVGLGNDKFTNESTNNLLRQFPHQTQQQHQGSAIFGAGGRGAQAGGTGNYDRPGGRDVDRAAGGAGALDDSDITGVNFNNVSRQALMLKLSRNEDASSTSNSRATPQTAAPKAKPVPANIPQASKCIVLHNMFNAEE